MLEPYHFATTDSDFVLDILRGVCGIENISEVLGHHPTVSPHTGPHTT